MTHETHEETRKSSKSICPYQGQYIYKLSCSSTAYFLSYEYFCKIHFLFSVSILFWFISNNRHNSGHLIKNNETSFSNGNINYFCVYKNSPNFMWELRLRWFPGSQISSLGFSTLCIHLIVTLSYIKAKVLYPFNWYIEYKRCEITSVPQRFK